MSSSERKQLIDFVEGRTQFMSDMRMASDQTTLQSLLRNSLSRVMPNTQAVTHQDIARHSMGNYLVEQIGYSELGGSLIPPDDVNTFTRFLFEDNRIAYELGQWFLERAFLFLHRREPHELDHTQRIVEGLCTRIGQNTETLGILHGDIKHIPAWAYGRDDRRDFSRISAYTFFFNNAYDYQIVLRNAASFSAHIGQPLEETAYEKLKELPIEEADRDIKLPTYRSLRYEMPMTYRLLQVIDEGLAKRKKGDSEWGMLRHHQRELDCLLRHNHIYIKSFR